MQISFLRAQLGASSGAGRWQWPPRDAQRGGDVSVPMGLRTRKVWGRLSRKHGPSSGGIYSREPKQIWI